jgi:hypothetical protein
MPDNFIWVAIYSYMDRRELHFLFFRLCARSELRTERVVYSNSLLAA